MKLYNKKLFFQLINLYFIISTILVTFFTISFGTVAGQVDTGSSYGLSYLATFTVDSNLLLGLVALISLIHTRRARHSRSSLPKSLPTLYLLASTLTMLTFLVVAFYLSPLRVAAGKSYFDMFLGPMFFFHFFNPILSALTLIFFLPSSQKLTLKSRLLALLPLALYGVFYFTCVIMNLFPDFYNLTFSGRYYFIPLVVFIAIALVFGIASTLAYFYNRTRQNHPHHILSQA